LIIEDDNKSFITNNKIKTEEWFLISKIAFVTNSQGYRI
jgi:hypothetical protein